VDSTAAKTLLRFAEKLTRAGAMVFLVGANPGVRRALLQAGLKKPLVRHAKSVEQALAFAKPKESAAEGNPVSGTA